MWQGSREADAEQTAELARALEDLACDT